jgi:hypothetical protein
VTATRHGLFLLPALHVLVLSCTGISSASRSGMAAGPQPVIVEVHNREFAAVQVYALYGGVPLDLGSVEGLSTRRFTVRWGRSVNNVELRAVSRHDQWQLTSPVVTVVPGQIMIWRVQRASGGRELLLK